MVRRESTPKRERADSMKTRYRVTVLLFLVFLIVLYFFEHRMFPEMAVKADQLLLIMLVIVTSYLWTKEREQQRELEQMMKKLLAAEADLHDHYVRTIEALILTLEAKDHDSRGHSRSVASAAAVIGRELEFASEELDTLIHASLLHDLGKLGIDTAILEKEDPLTREEFRQIKTHPITGSEILNVLPFLKKEQDIIRHHHERYDGTGYPDGLKGEEIPIGARVLAAADAFAVMTTGRPYEKAASMAEALERMWRDSGAQFDPTVVKALERAMLKEHPRAETLPAAGAT